MNDTIKIKLQGIGPDQYDIEEMIVGENGNILRVIPKAGNNEFRGLNLFVETCEIGKRPVLFRALGIYYLELPCVVTEVTPWTNEDYSAFETILFYPVTRTEDYMTAIYHKEYAISLNKKNLSPFYHKYNNIMGIEESLRDEVSNKISYIVSLNYEGLKLLRESRMPIASLMRKKIIEWEKIFPKAYFVIEYSKQFSNSSTKDIKP